MKLGKVVLMDHPLIEHKIGIIRNKDTGTKEFRKIVGEIAGLMCYESTRDLKLQEIEVETPLESTTAKKLSGKKLVLIPILRAGLGMVNGILELIPSAKVAHIGMYRDEKTAQPVEYYYKIPAESEEREFFVLDPMLATGGSAIMAIDRLKRDNIRHIRFMCIIAAPEGLAALRNAHSDVDIYIGALDRCLNETKYILPGLGDAGDRIFGTK